jgi:hypothetical protein
LSVALAQRPKIARDTQEDKMTRTTAPRLIAAALLSTAVAAPAAWAGDDQGFILRRDGAKAVPFVREAEPVAREQSFDWGDAALGAGVSAVLLASVGAGLARLRRRDLGPAWSPRP